jgi:hypothetical protein
MFSHDLSQDNSVLGHQSFVKIGICETEKADGLRNRHAPEAQNNLAQRFSAEKIGTTPSLTLLSRQP